MAKNRELLNIIIVSGDMDGCDECSLWFIDHWINQLKMIDEFISQDKLKKFAQKQRFTTVKLQVAVMKKCIPSQV